MNEKRVILVIEDEHTISNFICRALSANDYKPIPAFAGKEGLSLYFSHGPDLVLLDLGLPDMDGMEILQELSGLPQETPVIIISARDRESEKVKALDMGADDYLTKPFGTVELLARIRVGLKKRRSSTAETPAPASNVLRAGGLVLEPSSYTVTMNNQPINLTKKEFDLLLFGRTAQGVHCPFEFIVDTPCVASIDFVLQFGLTSDQRLHLVRVFEYVGITERLVYLFIFCQ